MIASWLPPEGVTLRLVLLRHGETEESVRGRCYGRLDVGLSERGKAQALLAARLLSSAAVDAVYSSPSRRARETASALAGDVLVDPRLGEIDFGVLEGVSYDEAKEKFPELYRKWMEAPTDVEFPGGESFSRMRARVLEAVSEMRVRHRDETIAVVSHGGVNRIVLAEALGLPPASIFRIGQSYGSLSVVDYLEETPVVALLNGVVAC